MRLALYYAESVSTTPPEQAGVFSACSYVRCGVLYVIAFPFFVGRTVATYRVNADRVPNTQNKTHKVLKPLSCVGLRIALFFRFYAHRASPYTAYVSACRF